MNAQAGSFSLSKNLDSLLAAIAGLLTILIFSRHSGIGISPDSVTYLSTARNWVQGNGFRSFDNLPTVDFPLAYPFILGCITRVSGMDPLAFAPMLNGLLFGVLLYVAGAMMNCFFHASGWYKRIILIILLFCPGLQEVYSMLWSETIFLILLLLFIICICRFLSESTSRWLLFSSLIASVICLTRYAGLFIVFTGAVLILTQTRTPFKNRIKPFFIFGFLSVAPFIANILRNYLLTGMATGPRPFSDSGLVKILQDFGFVIAEWLWPVHSLNLFVAFSVTVLLIFALAIYNGIKTRRQSGIEYVIAVTGGMYCVFMLFTYSLTRYETFSGRLLSPLFILFTWSASYRIPGELSSLPRMRKLISAICCLFLSAWLIHIEWKADYEYFDGVKDAGIPGYQEDPFVKTAIVQFLKNNHHIFLPGHPVYSNAGDAFYFVTGMYAHQLPFIDFPDQLEKFYQSGTEYLVWFNSEDNPQMPELKNILLNKKMILLQQLPDGAVYQSP